MKKIDKLQSAGAAYRFNGIIECLDTKEATSEEIEILKTLKDDSVIIAGRKISTYAYAVLDILGIEKYNGDDIDIIQLIEDLK